MRPKPIISMVANQAVQLSPILHRDRLVPLVELLEDGTQCPSCTRIRDVGQEWDGLSDPRRGLLFRRTVRIFRQPGARGAPGCEQIADNHVIEENLVQSASCEVFNVEMRVNVEHGNLVDRFLEL